MEKAWSHGDALRKTQSKARPNSGRQGRDGRGRQGERKGGACAWAVIHVHRDTKEVKMEDTHVRTRTHAGTLTNQQHDASATAPGTHSRTKTGEKQSHTRSAGTLASGPQSGSPRQQELAYKPPLTPARSSKGRSVGPALLWRIDFWCGAGGGTGRGGGRSRARCGLLEKAVEEVCQHIVVERCTRPRGAVLQVRVSDMEQSGQCWMCERKS